jgi:hypothetical protein
MDRSGTEVTDPGFPGAVTNDGRRRRDDRGDRREDRRDDRGDRSADRRDHGAGPGLLRR